MGILKPVLLIVGGLMMFMGLFWAAQGMGWIMWPADSFMLADRHWTLYGALTAILGAVMIYLARRPRA